MGLFRRKRKAPNDPEQVFGDAGYAFGPFQVVYDQRETPIRNGGAGAPSIAYLTEALPVEQKSGPSFDNLTQCPSVASPGQIGIPLQMVGLLVIGDPGNDTGQLSLPDALTSMSQVPGEIPLVIGDNNYDLPTA